MSKLPDVSKAQKPLESCYAHWFHFHEGGLWLNRMATFQGGKSELITSYALLRRGPPRLNEESKMINDIPVKRIYGDLTGKVSSPEMNTYDFSKRHGVCEKSFFMQVAKCNFSLGDPGVFLALFVANPPPWHWDSWRTSDFLCRLRLYWAHVEMIENLKWWLETLGFKGVWLLFLKQWLSTSNCFFLFDFLDKPSTVES